MVGTGRSIGTGWWKDRRYTLTHIWVYLVVKRICLGKFAETWVNNGSGSYSSRPVLCRVKHALSYGPWGNGTDCHRLFTRHFGSACACARYRQGSQEYQTTWSYTFWISIGHQTSLLNWIGSKLTICSFCISCWCSLFEANWAFHLSLLDGIFVCKSWSILPFHCIQWVHIGKGNTPKALKQLILATDVHGCPAIPSRRQPIDEYVVGTGRFQATERNKNSRTCYMQLGMAWPYWTMGWRL